MHRLQFSALRSTLLAILLTVQPLAAQGPSQRCDPICLSRQARSALASGRYDDYLRIARQLETRVPDHIGAPYAVARGFALVGQRDSAYAWLSRVADLGGGQNLASDSAFASIRDAPAFRALQLRFEANAAPIVRGRPAFSLPDPDLLPEALAWDAKRQVWLVGSLAKRKVIRVAANGSSADVFTGPKILRVVGIHVDPARQLVWFATYAYGNADTSDPIVRTRLFRVDPAGYRILRSYEPSDSTTSHLFNDLAIARNGTVYVTDTREGCVYRITPEGDSLEVFVRPDPDRYSGANGIALTDDGRTLYVAFLEGILRIDVSSRQSARLSTPLNVNATGIDGLYWYRGDLIGIQNVPGLERVVRFELDEAAQAVRTSIVLERSSDLLNVPTTGAILGTHFYYVANSQANRIDDADRLTPPRVMPPPLTVIRVIDLERRE
jgi:hypothetical protein